MANYIPLYPSNGKIKSKTIIQMKKQYYIAALFSLLFTGCGLSLFPDKGGLVTNNTDWPAFLSRQDPVWEKLPENFDEGAFLGNGLMGAMIFRQAENQLRWEMGRSDVTEHRRDNHRLPIGGLVLETAGIIQEGTLRLDIWNAEVRGQIVTDKGSISFRTLIHTEKMAMILDLETSGEESAAVFRWDPGHGQDPRNQRPGRPALFDDPLNPPAFTEQIGGMPVSIQPRYAGGEFATAWKEVKTKKGRRIFLSIADSYPGNTARSVAANTVNETADANFGKLESSHREWWHKLYPQSLISVPDPKLESFYWIQIYKLGAASRPDRVPVDLLGPWYRDTGWPRIWWNLNIQTLYLPVYAANQLMLGESFIRLIDGKRDNFVRNAKDIWGLEDAATVSHTTCYEGLRGDGSSAPDHYINPGDFTWALHNYYLHYRHSMDHSMITDHEKHAFYPLLKGSVNLYLNLLKEGEDGKLHLPVLHSPEYGADEDNNYNLSLLRWALQTLIGLNERYGLNDPLLPKWSETLANLTPYPVDENGFRIGSGVSYTKSHRHWSHLLMVHPLQIMDFNDPESRELTIRSIRHWLTVDEGRQVYGWSRAAAASLYAVLGEGDNAIAQIHGHMADKRFVRPNTMYIEGSPVIECSIILGRSLQDMLLQSHNNLIRIFPAVPSTWDEAVFHDLLTEGAFLVSAARKNGVTQWVRIKSLAGEPCRINPGLAGEVKATVPLKNQGNGIYELDLLSGGDALLYTGSEPPVPVVEPVAADPAQTNFWGVK
jgi:alpha-L-fucosidase 2